MTITQQETSEISLLYGEYAPLLRNLIRTRFKVPDGDIDGLVHDVFAGYLRSHHHVEDAPRWLVGAACNASRYYWRRYRPEVELPESSSTGEAEELQALLTVHFVLRRLDAGCRALLQEHYLEGYSAAELATRGGTTRGAAQQLLHRCLKAARQFARKEQL